MILALDGYFLRIFYYIMFIKLIIIINFSTLREVGINFDLFILNFTLYF